MNTKWAEVIAANAKALREALGLTQAALAERTGLVFTVVSRLESGRHLPSLATLLRVAEGLGVEPGDLLRRAARKKK